MRFLLVPLALLVTACGEDVVEEIEDVVLDTDQLTGLYENARGDRLCLVEEEDDRGTFGLVALGTPPAACSGAGGLLREGDTLRLAFAGDSQCAFDARMANGVVTFPAAVPGSCAYYCSEATSLAGRTFTKSGDGPEAARSASDLVGDPLCP